MDVLRLIMILSDVNVVKKLKPFICHRNRENHISPTLSQTDGRTDILNYRVASLLIINLILKDTFIYFFLGGEEASLNSKGLVKRKIILS